MKLQIIIFLIMTISIIAKSQDDSLPFRELEDQEGNYTSGNVTARLVDGLGFRLYWATESLSDKDINFKAKEDIRTISETLDHIHEMSVLIVNSIFDETTQVNGELSFEEKRKEVLLNLKRVSDRLKESTENELETYSIKWNGKSIYPFYNMINGPISDAIWHCGQIVSLRRMAGNPFNGKVSVLTGKVRD